MVIFKPEFNLWIERIGRRVCCETSMETPTAMIGYNMWNQYYMWNTLETLLLQQLPRWTNGEKCWL